MVGNLLYVKVDPKNSKFRPGRISTELRQSPNLEEKLILGRVDHPSLLPHLRSAGGKPAALKRAVPAEASCRERADRTDGSYLPKT